MTRARVCRVGGISVRLRRSVWIALLGQSSAWLGLSLATAARAEAPRIDATLESPGEAPAGHSGAAESSATLANDTDTTGSGLFEQSLAGTAIPSERGTPAAAGFELNGYVRSDLFVGEVPPSHETGIAAAYGELALKVNAKRDFGGAFAEARLRLGQQGEERDLFIELREAYVDAHFARVDLRLGHQIIVWGRADAFNPTNNLMPFDLRIRSPVEDDRRVGNWGARAFVSIAPVRLEGVWIPLYSPVEFPPVEPAEFVTLSEPQFPNLELSKGLGAGRVHLELPSFEMSASFLRGYAPLPGFALSSFTVGVDPPEIRIARTAYKQHVVGLDFSTALGDELGIRGEAAYRRPVDYQNRVYAPRPDLQYVFGADRSFGSVSVILQYVGRYVFDWRLEEGAETPIPPAALAGFMPPLPLSLEQMITDSINGELAARNQILFSQTRRVQHLSSLRVEWLTLHDTLSLSALGLVNFTTEERLLYPKIGYQLSDGVSATVGAEIYAGPANTLLDLIDERLTAGYAELKLSF